MTYEKYTALSVSQTLSEFNVNPATGYSNKHSEELLAKFGPNEVVERNVTWFVILLRQFKSAFIYLLIFASGVTFFLGEKLDSFLILLFVVINVLLGFFQEYKSELTAKFLKKYTNKKATVIRDGEEQVIPAPELVPGDIVVVETGDIVPADLRLIETDALLVDESTLTGESVQMRKTTEVCESAEKQIIKAVNIVFSGTTVVEGKGLGVVVATGKNTEFGKIAGLTTQTEGVSAFENQINRFSKFVLFLILITLTVVFTVKIIYRSDLSVFELVIYSIALAVGVIPEAMPLVTTFSLSTGASNLAKKKVIVKRLSAIEDLGGIEILCTDKTGTITENKLTISDIFSKDPQAALKAGILSASSLDKTGTPNNAFDLALMAKLPADYAEITRGVVRLYEIPFNPSRRRNSSLIKLGDSKILIVRGAVEAVMPYVKGMTSAENGALMSWVLKEGRSGKRILAIAQKAYASDTYEIHDEEHDLELVGLISFEDPIKSTTYDAIRKAKELGISTKVITGDSPEVAVAVGIKIGLATKQTDVITGDEFISLSKTKQKKVARRIHIFARMTPEQKYEVVKLFQEDYQVGFLGEGINDGPALKAAGVAIVVDNAADVSREVADIILLQHDLQVIIDGVEMGRKTFVNVTNYIKATLASNFGNFYAMAFVTLMIDFLPMLPVQILLVNLLSDFPMISIATDNIDKNDIKSPQGYALKDFILYATILGLISTAFDFMMFGIFKHLGAQGLQTYWFIGSILTELVLIYSVRTKGWCFSTHSKPSLPIFLLTVVAAFLTVFIPFTAFGAEIFKFITPSWDKLALIFGIVVAYLASTEIVKHVYFKYLGASK